jgi:hypothetical protein
VLIDASATLNKERGQPWQTLLCSHEQWECASWVNLRMIVAKIRSSESFGWHEWGGDNTRHT